MTRSTHILATPHGVVEVINLDPMTDEEKHDYAICLEIAAEHNLTSEFKMSVLDGICNKGCADYRSAFEYALCEWDL